ncbi:MAG: thermonuclease family protein [Alphaproteobacteria bacterium]|nr:thermonuclease family protein [Alphaproteobacteria bacterium]
MGFLKKIMLGFGALFLILAGGAGTQSSSTLLQGGGFFGLLIGLVILYLFARMAWRAMGCLPSALIIVGIIVFILYAIGAFNNGVGGIVPNVRSFLGQNTAPRQFSRPANVPQELDEEFYEEETAVSGQYPEEQPSGGVEELVNRLSEGFGGAPAAQQAARPAPAYPTIYGAAGVVSGDTLKINGRFFKLYGIDAPELNQRCADGNGRSYSCGKVAARWLRDWIMDNPLECRIMQQDKKGNMVGNCALGPYDLGAAIVNAGWAVAYEKYTEIYVPYEQQAKMNRRGLWRGKFYKPWDWRQIQQQRPEIKITRPKRKHIGDIFE